MSSPDGAMTLMLSDIADAADARPGLGAERWEQLVSDHHLLVERVARASRRAGRQIRAATASSPRSTAPTGACTPRSISSGRSAATASRLIGRRAPRRRALRLRDHGQPRADLLGRNVVLAARIAAQAKAGEILVSSALKEYTETDPSFRFEHHGEHHFKGLLGEHEVYTVRWRAESRGRGLAGGGGQHPRVLAGRLGPLGRVLLERASAACARTPPECRGGRCADPAAGPAGAPTGSACPGTSANGGRPHMHSYITQPSA